MKILYAGELALGTSSSYRLKALERLGHQIISIDPLDYVFRNQVLHKIAFRLSAGPQAYRLNRDLLRLIEAERPDLFWADKVLLLKPRTLEAMTARGVVTVSYMIDNAFGPRQDPGWRLYMKDIPYFDLHITQRDVSLADYMQHGAQDAMKVQTAFEPTIHFPSPVKVTDQDRDREISFIGTPYDDRALTLTNVNDTGLPVAISGNPRAWRRALSASAFDSMFRIGELYEQDYREAIWKSKINLSFLTHSNQDEYAHKSFEIAGCGGFLMAERSEGHSLKFEEDVEAVFFSDTKELVEKIKRYLPDEQARMRIAAAGRARAVRAGYDNDHQVASIIERAEQILARKKRGPRSNGI